MTKLLHLCESLLDRMQIRHLLLNFGDLGIDAMDDIDAALRLITLQFEKFFDLPERETQPLHLTDKSEPVDSGSRILPMTALRPGWRLHQPDTLVVPQRLQIQIADLCQLANGKSCHVA